MVWVYWTPRPPISQWFTSDLDMDPNGQSRIVAHARQGMSRPGCWYMRLCSGTNTVIQMHCITAVQNGAQIVTLQSITACSSWQLLPLHMISLPRNNRGIWFRQWNGNGSCVVGRTDGQTAIVDDASLWKANCVPILLSVSFWMISVMKLWDMIIGLWMRKGYMGRVQVLDFNSSWSTSNELGIVVSITFKWESKIQIKVFMSVMS